MAATNEVPFARYYGSVDSTPLFVVLAGAALAGDDDQLTGQQGSAQTSPSQ
jgi:glycogen debranching enzyme